MKIDEVFTYVKAASFIPDFTNLKYDSMFRHKMRGVDGNGKKIEFSKEEKQQIKTGLRAFVKKVSK